MDETPFKRRDYNWDKNRRFGDSLFCGSDRRYNAGLLPGQILERQKLERFLRHCASEVDVKLKKVSLDKVPEVEVFFDVFYDGKKVCYLLKQWNSPMIRFGDTIKLPKDFKDFKERFYKIHHICAVNYITLLFPPAAKKDSDFEISLETAVYLDNFNERVLEKAVDRFKRCKDKIQPLLIKNIKDD